MANPIRFSEIFDFTNDKDVQTAIKTIKSLDKVYTNFINNGKKLKGQYSANIQEIIKATAQLNKVVAGLNPTLEKDQQQLSAASKSMDILTASSEGLTKKTATLGSSIKKLESEQKKFNKSASETVRLEKEEAKLKAKLAALDSNQAKKVQELKVKILEKNKALKQSAKESLGLVSIYQKESARLADLSKRYKDYVVAGKQGTAAARQLKREHDQLRASIVKADQATGQFNRNVGNYRSALGALSGSFRQLATALGFTGVIFALVGAIRSGIKTVISFQKENAVLAGVLDKTRLEIGDLTSDAQRLGSITAKTASEVTQLQIAYARLGFTQEEILNLTEDTINGSIALNAALDETAELTGAVIRTFDDLTTVDADVVLDQMTAATQRSALSFEKLQTSLPIVAGAANAAGISFTRLLALLGKLSDAGIDASMSATALRNIFIESASQGLNYEQILVKIGKSSDQLTASTDQFGKRAAVSGTILSNLTEEVGKLDTQLINAGGTIERVANEQLDTMSGDLALLASAWEGWILSIDKGDGVISRFVRGSLQALTDLLNSINSEIEKQEGSTNKYFQQLKDGETTVGDLEAEISKLEASVTAQGRAATKQRELIRGQKEELEDAIMFYKSYNQVQQEATKLSKEEGITIEELNRRLEENQKQVESLSRTSSRGASQSQEESKQRLSQLQQEQHVLRATIPLIKETATITGSGVDETEKLTKAQSDQIKQFQFLVDTSRDFSEELNPEEIEKLEKATTQWGDSLVETGKKASEGFAPVIETVGTTLPENLDEYESKTESTLTRMQDLWNKFSEQIKIAISTAFEVATIAVNQFFTNQSIRRQNSLVAFEEQQDAEIERIEERRERELSNERLSADAKEAINRKYNNQVQKLEEETEKKRKATQRKQARAEKAQALFNATINTAQAVIEGLLTGGPILAAAYGVIGGAQIAAIASEPLPRFAKGTENAPGGMAVVGEEGRELVMEPSGKTYLTGSGPELIDLPKGSQVLTNSITERILKQGSIIDEGEQYNRSASKIQEVARQEKFAGFKDALRMTMEKENDHMVKMFMSGLSKLPLNNWSFNDKGHVTRSVAKGNTIRKDVSLENKY